MTAFRGKEWIACFCACLALFVFSGKGECADMNENIRKPVLAGAWYPGTATALRSDIVSFLENVPPVVLPGKVIALISPHAGIVYSGQVAAYGFEAVERNDYDAVIVVGISHRARFNGAALYDGGGYETPLGVAKIDRGLAEQIIDHGGNRLFFSQKDPAPENSIEIQVPFLQVALEGLPFVPVMMGSQDMSTCRMLADAILAATAGRRVLLVASTDLSHYHGYDAAMKLDSLALENIETMDIEGFTRCVSTGSCEACGAGPVIVAMMVAEKLGARARILHYANSGDVTGDKSGVVGYGSVAFYLPDAGEKEDEPERGVGVDMGLSETDKDLLLDLARKSIETKFTGGDVPACTVDSEILKQNMGAFVTLKKHGQLRGCIGFIEGRKPLLETVKEMARAAAFQDPRFRPVSREELDELTIEISALTPLRQIKDANEITVGTHGIYIVKGFRSGLLLPQVATEHHWDRIKFLQETCHKAGLPSDAWKDKESKIFIFSADIFGEEE
ncbi:MAG: AmmeMemoRadiSam system protein B [Deltaproteobacteria bacterium]|nr:AmmeMemoRadiSam system protein B [Deltaproteobacteria bacterium]